MILRYNTPLTKIVREIKGTAKIQAINNCQVRWKGKPLHGQYVQRVEKEDIDKELTHKWLQSSDVKAETQGLLIAAQDQSLATRHYQHEIIKNGASTKFRLCHEFDESIEHITSGCPAQPRNEYLERHDKALIYIHWHICKHYEIEVIYKWYDHKPNTVTEGRDVAILWDMPIHTDKEIKAHRPDIIVKGKSKSNASLLTWLCHQKET